MIRQYLSQTNESATVAKSKNFSHPNSIGRCLIGSGRPLVSYRDTHAYLLGYLGYLSAADPVRLTIKTVNIDADFLREKTLLNSYKILAGKFKQLPAEPFV